MSAQRRVVTRPRSADQIAETTQDRFAGVVQAAAAEAGGLDPELLGGFLDRLAEPGMDRRWDRRERAGFVALGSRAAEQGVALQALIDLYLSAAWRAWPTLPATSARNATTVRAAGLQVLRSCDDVVAAVAEGFTAARRAIVHREASQHREFVDDLLAGVADPAELLARAEAYGLQLAGRHAVVLAEGDTAFDDTMPALSRADARLAAALRHRRGLVATRDGRLVAVIPAGDGPELAAATSAVQRALTQAGARRPAARRLAVGRPHSGPSGVARSYREAVDALELAERLQLPDPVVRAADLLVFQVLLRDRTALRELVEDVLAPLRQARGGAAPLLETLDAYLATGANTTRAAARLHLSVRAVGYRLARIAALTGRHPADPADRYVLQTAALGARIIDWA